MAVVSWLLNNVVKENLWTVIGKAWRIFAAILINAAELNMAFREMNFAAYVHDKWRITITKRLGTALQIIHTWSE